MGITSVAVSPVTLCRELRKSRRGGVMIGADGDPTPIWIRPTVRKNCHRLFKGPKSAPIHTQTSGGRKGPPETNAQIAGNGAAKAVSRPDLRADRPAKPRKYRQNLRRPLVETRKRETEWWCWQSNSNSSLFSISLFSASLQGIWLFRPKFLSLASEFSPQKQSLGQELPVRLISEFLAVCREWNARNREFRPSVIAVIRERVVVKWEAIVVIRDGNCRYPGSRWR